MKALYNKKKRLMKEIRNIGVLLDNEIEERFGFHYGKVDFEPAIDTLDYGTSDLSYIDFIERMNEYKKDVENGDIDINP